MLKKKLPLAIPFVLLLVLSMVATAGAAPTVSVKLCVGLEGQRAANSTEELIWELRSPGTTTVLHSNTTAGTEAHATVTTAGTKGCFSALGVPNDIYDLWIDPDDALGVLVSGFSYPPMDSDVMSGGSIVTLIEGDSAGDNGSIDGLDLGTFSANWGTSNDQSDLQEDGNTDGLDLGLFVPNFGTSVTTARSRSAKAAKTSVPQAVSIVVGDAVGAPGSTVSVPVTLTATTENIGSLSLDAFLGNDPSGRNDIEPSDVAISYATGWTGLSCSAPLGDACLNAFNFAAPTGTFQVATIDVTLPNITNCGKYDVQLMAGTIGTGSGGTYIFSSGTQVIPTITDGTVGCSTPTSVNISAVSANGAAGNSTTLALILATMALLSVATLQMVQAGSKE